MKRIYLDHASTTPLHPQVREAMVDALNQFGNPSSLHQDGRNSKHLIDTARERVSDALGAMFAEVIFTGSGSEAANLAVFGAALAAVGGKRNTIVLGAGEHHCVLNTKENLERLGYQVVLAPLLRDSSVDLNQLESLVDDSTLLISVMHANNETGRMQPVAEVAKIAHQHGALYHCDAVQTFLKDDLPSAVEAGADLVNIAAHKINGPKGVGALYIRAGTQIKPVIPVGGQERELRAGTENVVNIVGFGEAVKLRRSEQPRVRELRDAFMKNLIANGAVETIPGQLGTLSGHAHVRFPGIDAETLLIKFDRMGLSASSGSACSSGSVEPSHVLLASGYSDAESKEGLRFTFGLGNTIPEAIRASELVIEAVNSVLQTRQPR